MRWLTSEDIAGTIIGGVAVSIRGRPRFTRDVNAVILADDVGWKHAVDSAAQYGLVPRVEDVLEFAARSRMLLLRHDASGVEVDVSLGALPVRARNDRSFDSRHGRQDAPSRLLR